MRGLKKRGRPQTLKEKTKSIRESSPTCHQNKSVYLSLTIPKTQFSKPVLFSKIKTKGKKFENKFTKILSVLAKNHKCIKTILSFYHHNVFR